MKPKSRTKPQTLDDLVFGAGLPLAETYGWMDMPDLSQADQDRLYHEVSLQLTGPSVGQGDERHVLQRMRLLAESRSAVWSWPKELSA